MSALIECIPNLSEGRDQLALDQLWSDLQQIQDLQCLHRCSDWDHHRSVLTLAGSPQAIRQAVHQLYQFANTQIDLRSHQGVHPRIGAVDVVPLVPLQGMTQTEAIDFSHQLAAEIAERWPVPIYLYEQSAQCQNRQALPDIRKGQFEKLSEKMSHADWRPDYGPEQPHLSLGASVLGVRNPLIAWNVMLESQELTLAQGIARQIRERNGGFKALRALGFELKSCQQVQISMNLVDFEQSSLFDIFSRVQELAETQGVSIARTEFIGLVPRRALYQMAWQALHAQGNVTGSVLEDLIGDLASL